MPKYTCSNCNRTFDYTEKDLQSLSGVEMAICAKEGLDIGSTAKLVCPFCDTAVLLQGAVRPEQTSTRTLSMAGRDYPIYTSLQDVGVSAARGNRCGFETTFKAIPSNHNEILRAANDENGKYVNFETELMVKCSKCQSSLSQKAVQYLLLSEMAGSIAMMGGGGSGLNQLLEGHCPKCGGTGCFYLFDPAGFEAIRGGHAAEPEKKKGFWPFRK